MQILSELGNPYLQNITKVISKCWLIANWTLKNHFNVIWNMKSILSVCEVQPFFQA